MKRNKSQQFKETTWMITTVSHWSTCKCNNKQAWFTCFFGIHLYAYSTFAWAVFVLVRQMDQQRQQLAVRFYAKWYFVRSGVGILARQIRLAMTRMLEPQTKYHSLSLLVLTKCFLLLGLSFSHSKNIFHSKSNCYMALTRYLNLHWKMHFPAIYSMQSFNNFCPSGATMVCIWAKRKLVKFYRNFWRYNFEKLIRTQQKLGVGWARTTKY